MSPRAFHDGELDVQQRAGVRDLADRLEGMLENAYLGGGLRRFLAERRYGALSARDDAGRLWVTALIGERGFLEAVGPTRLRVHTAPAEPDPLHGLPTSQPVGLLVIEYATRRRVRINGVLVAATAHSMDIETTEAYGNCPKYIPPHPLDPAAPGNYPATAPHTVLTPADRTLIAHAVTFVLGTTHAIRGNDASHRGGPPGFVRADPDGTTLRWPDYPGNNMFNSLGNLAVDPTAALLFTDFSIGATLHLTGTADLRWATPGYPEPDVIRDTGRTVVFTVTRAVTASLSP